MLDLDGFNHGKSGEHLRQSRQPQTDLRHFGPDEQLNPTWNRSRSYEDNGLTERSRRFRDRQRAKHRGQRLRGVNRLLPRAIPEPPLQLCPRAGAVAPALPRRRAERHATPRQCLRDNEI